MLISSSLELSPAARSASSCTDEGRILSFTFASSVSLFSSCLKSFCSSSLGVAFSKN